MSKRKVVAGGYEESSDGPDSDPTLELNPLMKKAKSVPYAPPRFGAVPKARAGSFQLPRSRSASTRGSVPPGPTSASLHPMQSSEVDSPDLRMTPSAQDDSTMLKAISSYSDLEGHSSGQPTDGDDTNPKSEGPKTKLNNNQPAASSQPIPTRSNIFLERQFDELKNRLEEHVSSNDEQHKRTQDSLARLFEAMSRLPSTDNVTFTPGTGTSTPTGSVVINTKAYLANPIPTPELIAIVFKVAAEARYRVGKKKGGSDDNSLKEHARTTFYRMLGILVARAIHPYFEDEHGEPDTLPIQFVDHDTNYCQPYPHWKASITRQVAWIPTYILRFRSTIPNDRSELSTTLKNLSDEQIVILLIDGPFKTAQTAWRDMKKTDEELEIMRANARKYQRTDRKATTRGRYIKTIPSLQGQEWEYLSHPGYMSQDESDGEGGVITKRPDHRAQWETNLYEAIRVAHLEKAKAQPGLCPRPPRRRIEVVRRPIPHLERGTGSNKVTVRISLCGVSRSWRDKHPGELQKYSHLINLKATAKPNITAFLAQNPMTSDNNDDDNDSDGDNIAWSPYSRVGEGAGEGKCAINGEGGRGLGDRFGGSVGPAGNVEGDVEGEGEGDVGDDGDVEDEGHLELSVRMGGDRNHRDNVNVPIDPQLLPYSLDNNGPSGDKIRPRPVMRIGSTTVRSVSPSASAARQASPEPASHMMVEPNHGWPLSGVSMPPPPPPEPSSTNDGITVNYGKHGELPRQSKKQIGSAKTLSQGDSAQDSSNIAVAPDASQPKRRGRPPGSKNKPKA